MAETHGWTLDTLCAHITSIIHRVEAHFEAVIEGNDKRYGERFDAQEKATVAALAAAEKATTKAEDAASKRAEVQNEWRGAMNDRERNLMPRLEQEGINKSLAERLSLLENGRFMQVGQGAGTQAGWMWAVGAVGLILTVITIISVVIAVVRQLHP